ncbi:MAG TPA: threonine ammonia-lyase [Solirubrobacteraceae bacterium]|nr:threonine ammonia-lyase [Solirubrobacteraceae bacterium]
MSVTADDVAAARERIADVARPTPVLPSATLTDRLGASIALKAENLQRTGSFKVRGATNKVSALGDRCAAGVVAGSAGNHAQALAHAAHARGVPCEVFMPAGAPLSKIEGAEALGAKVIVGGDSVLDCLAAATARADEARMTVVHPFDDPDVIAGQGTLGLELLDDVPDLAKVVVPIGGGGLSSGVAIALKAARPEIEVVGVQVETCAPFADQPVDAARSLTIADGIAVKRPGRITLPLVREWVDEVVTVSEEQIAEAMVLLLEKAKQVVEGAGAVGVAALMFERTPPAAEGTTVAVLSGGNVDAGLLADVARRHETEVGRRLLVQSRIGDRPGELASLLAVVGEQGANLIEVQHVREGLDLHVRETAVQLVLETRGRDHAAAVLEAIRAGGYEARVLR